MTFSSFGTLFLDHNVSQLFVMPQLTIAERQFLVEHYFKVIDMEEIMDLWSCPKKISGIRQETLISLFGNMVTRLEVYVDHDG